MTLRVATYNVHGGVGLDRRYDPSRIAAVIRELDADVIALQELQSRGGVDMLDVLRRATGMTAVAAFTFDTAHGHFGNGLLTRWPITSEEYVDLSIAGREPRNAIDVMINCGDEVRIIATHLGLLATERRAQATRLIAALKKKNLAMTTILMGDINDWALKRHATAIVQAQFGRSDSPATFPSFLPLKALDRVWVSPPSALLNVASHRSALARVASDHLPLVAQVQIGISPEPAQTV
jgi:endonuclease/exonuclease/phosphatase family metal-dependent hydrolase